MQSLRHTISNMIPISEEELDVFLGFCEQRSFRKKELLSDDDRYIDEVYFITKGIIRVKITDTRGKEHTTHFAIEQQFIADYNAFLTQQKSRYQLEALEDTEVIVLPKQAIEWGYRHVEKGEKLGRLIAESYFVYLDTRIQQGYTLLPIERYSLMNEVFPNIHNRVPQRLRHLSRSQVSGQQ